MFGVEAGGKGLETAYAAPPSAGTPGVLHGNRTYLMTDGGGQIQEILPCLCRLGLSRSRPGARLAERP